MGIAWARGDAFPHGAPLAWGLVAGATAGVALACFYVALSRGAMGASAALSGLLAAAIPAGVSAGIEGSPGLSQVAGFVVAGVAIWLIAAGENPEATTADRGTVWLAVVGGVGFGIYFVALKMAGAAGVVWPLATARMGSLGGVFAAAGGDGFAGRGGYSSVVADGSGVGAGGGAAGYFGEFVVYCGDAGGKAGCGGGARFALSGVDDSTGSVDFAGTADPAAGVGDGCGGGSCRDDYALTGCVVALA